jgi:hypothetical protein
MSLKVDFIYAEMLLGKQKRPKKHVIQTERSLPKESYLALCQ